LTDTFGTPAFLEAFRKPIPEYTIAGFGADVSQPSGQSTTEGSATDSLAETKPPVAAPIHQHNGRPSEKKTYAQVFQGVRQDSGDPTYFVKMIRDFYDNEGIKDKKTIVFSDSLNVDACLEYKVIAEEAGFQPVFGVGTFFTSKFAFLECPIAGRITDSGEILLDDFRRKSTGEKSLPLNIVIKIATAGGRAAVKLSDNLGKNTGDKETVQDVKKRLGYIEHTWEKGDESGRWGKKGE
jgi:nicotinate phosphoribosyltransferase